MRENTALKVFISYSHIDENYEKKILALANRLRTDGIDANVDLYVAAPKEGWQRWMENEIRDSDFVLIVSDSTYWKKCYNNHAKGISWEVNLVYQLLYDKNSENTKFIPVFWNAGDDKYILTPLKSFTYYNIGTDKGYEDLKLRLLGLPKYNKPELGKINLHKLETLPSKKQRTMFFTTPIDVESWNKAGWFAMVYMLYPNPDIPPVLGFAFRDYEAGIDIFKKWKNNYKGVSPDDYITVTFIVPPFPKDCYVYKNADSNYGAGYFVHIGANIEKTMERAQAVTQQNYDDILLTIISRFIWMNEFNGNQNREKFKELIEKRKALLLVPVAMKDKTQGFKLDNWNIGINYALELHSIAYKRGVDLSKNDECYIVLKEK